MFCKHCGAELASDSLFCHSCGKRVAEGGKASVDEPAAPSIGSQAEGDAATASLGAQAESAAGAGKGLSPLCIAACILSGIAVLLLFSSSILGDIVALAALIVSIVALRDTKKRGQGGRVVAIVCIIVSAAVFGLYLLVAIVMGTVGELLL